MRVIVKEYASGGHGAFELSKDGGMLVGEWDGPRRVGERICAYLEVSCADTEEGYRRLLDSMAWLAEEIEKRKGVGQAQPAESPAKRDES